MKNDANWRYVPPETTTKRLADYSPSEICQHAKEQVAFLRRRVREYEGFIAATNVAIKEWEAIANAKESQ